ncbi:efflux RND transporter permease subunit [Nannocystis sp.]|uniref:efflux RND transporter permease subunit n=1 Tax=Nannocystis sp. TaxID=1962667 RepID=UPI0025E540F7|nr:efflux RND transporter permease subunit [Nannocystis sp.]MBK7828170.1 efflux RND transporter permease subunit [Nannocystis sp.]
MKIAEISIRRSVFAAMLIAALMVFGFYSLPKIGVELFPNVEFPVITTTVIYPGADPETMESKVADPIEEALQSISGVKRMTSRNYESVTSVIMEFELEVDGNQALQDVRDKVTAIERELPRGIDPPVIQKFNTGAAPVLSVALASDMPIRDLTKLAKDEVKQRIQQVPGVGTVDLIGAREREVKVLVDPARMIGFGLTVDDVTGAIQAGNIELPAGYVKTGGSELTIKTKGEVKSAAEIGDIVIRGVGGAAIRVHDVAEVVDDVEEARSASFLNGEAALALVVRKQSGANVVALAEQVREVIEEMKPELEKRGVKLAMPTDNSVFAEHAIDDVKFDLVLGALLTIIIILVFLHDIRATFIAALAIPTSVVATFAFMSYMGFSFNNISMLALSLSIGILVDDAIVVIENIYRHLEMGKPRMRAALDATSEIGLAVIATTLSIVAVFVPVAYMSGIIGRFFFQFGLTVSAAVLLSMLVSFTLTPMLSSRLMRMQHASAPGLFARLFDRGFAAVERVYSGVLRWALRWPWTTVALAIATLVASIGLVTRVPTEFIPQQDQSQFSVNVELPTGTGLDATVATAQAIGKDIRDNLDGIKDTFTTIGGGAQGQVNRAQTTVTLKPRKQRGYSQQEAMQWARDRFAGIAGVLVTVEEVNLFGGDGGFRTQPVQFSIRGTNLDEVTAAAQALRAELDKTGKFVDLDITYRGGKPEVAIQVDRNKAADLGVPVAAVARTIRALMAGDTISDLKEGSDIYDVILQMPEAQRANVEALNNLKVRSVTGQLVDLASVVRVGRGSGPSEIERQNRLRQIVVLADIKGVTLGEAQKLVNEAAARVVPAHLTTSYLGDAEIMIEAFTAMLLALALAIVLVYMILAAQFDSLTQPIVIMISLPLSVVGAFGGIYLAGMTLNIFSFIGLIMLMGLVTKTAILLVDFANSERAQGAEIKDALLKAGRIRLRPIVMTAAATVFGMVPVALALGEGGEARAPMAVIVIGGMITSTVLTLVVVPVAYLLFDRLTTSRSMKWIGRKFFGIDPNLPAESLDAPWAAGLNMSPHLAGHVSPDLSARSDADDPVASDLVIPNIVKPGHRE